MVKYIRKNAVLEFTPLIYFILKWDIISLIDIYVQLWIVLSSFICLNNYFMTETYGNLIKNHQ